MGTEVIPLPATATEDQEEGEIIDVEAYENMDLESISSEEEENLKDRIRELETRNKELEKLAAVAKEERRTYNYDNSDFVEISSEEETYFEPKSKFHVRMLHPIGRRNGLSRGKNRKTDLRYKSPEKFRNSNNMVSPDFKRRRKSLSPEYYQKSTRNDYNRERPRNERVSDPYSNSRSSRDHKKKKKRNNKRDYSDSGSEDDKHMRTQLNAAVKRDTRLSTMNFDNPLMRKLKLRPGSANKENERYTNGDDIGERNEKDMDLEDAEQENEDDELIALRLQALKSKAEVKEIINETKTDEKPPAKPSDEFDQEELELRMIALKSAIVKKAVTRKKQNEKPYSPTDGLEWTPTSPDNPYASSESNMEISPAISPTLDDAVLQPIDMEIATPDNMSNSPTFYSFDESSKNVSNADFMWSPFVGGMPPMIVPMVIHPQIAPIMPKMPVEFLSRPLREELTGSCRSNTPPCAQASDFNSSLRPRSRSLDSLRAQNTTENGEKVPETEDPDEEQALRTLLLATMSPHRQPKKVLLQINSSDDIEGNLKRAASRFKELSEHEEELIEASLDKILSKTLAEDENESIIEAEREKLPPVSLKDVVQRLKLSQAKAKLLKVTDELPVEEKIIEPTVIDDTESLSSEAVDSPKAVLDVVDSPKMVSEVVDGPKMILDVIDSPKIVPEPKTDKKPLPTVTQMDAIAQLQPKQITNAMSSITVNKPKTVLTAPVIMKRKLKTNSSIINVPFQHTKPTTSNIPSTSNAILSLESVIKPVPKVIIRLGQSDSESSDSESDSGNEEDLMNQSAVASPSHINEFNDVASPVAEKKNELPATFESKLDEFLKQARAKTENVSPNIKSPAKARVVVKTVQKTPSAVRHLPLSSQIEYKNLLAKMQLLEKQKQSKTKPKINLEAGGNIKVTVVNDIKAEIPLKDDPPPCDTFESRLAKMSDEQREKALEKYETSYNDFSLQFETQLTDFMDKITDATTEKRKQIQLEMEAEELRAKLAAVESQLGHQREKVRKMFPKITTTHKGILASRDKYVKMGKCCAKLGQTVKGVDYQFTSEAREKIVERLKQLPATTKSLKNVKEEYMKELEEKATNPNVYQSVLECMTTETGTNSNHDGVLCPFDLSGKCSDKECKYVHLP